MHWLLIGFTAGLITARINRRITHNAVSRNAADRKLHDLVSWYS